MTKRNSSTIELHEEVAVMKNDIDYIKRDMVHIKNKMDKFIDSADEKYACKSVENDVKNINLKLAYYAGAVAIIFILINFGMKYFIK